MVVHIIISVLSSQAKKDREVMQERIDTLEQQLQSIQKVIKEVCVILFVLTMLEP